ncbi:MAG: 50S ribosomal protein L4 [Candidatus Omnitrophica bacterium]|nr:50S ribosomal protein L4 [Candidatus Omnitrophota bacterium]MCM8790100.1 50S ribosomal protein L4 [Candidatus Omnitrophota bacterium]
MENKRVRNSRKTGIPKIKTTPTGEFKPAVPVYDLKGKEVETFQLDKNLFTGKVNKAAIYQAVLMYSANARQGNASTKTRAEVSGGGKKPWRQKGTGRARAGSTRSPLWRHGGIIFGPHPRDYAYDLPKKIKRLAFLSSINSKLNENRMKGILSITIAESKTKAFKAIVDALKLDGKSLFVLENIDENILRASRNLEDVLVKNYKDFNTMDVLRCNNLVISKAALQKLPERFK